MGGGLAFYQNTNIIFDSINRCNIYNNFSFSGMGADLCCFSDSIVSVIVDTFTILNPDTTHAYPINKFTFDILHDTLGNPNIIEKTNNIPLEFTLKQNYPNPFNPSTTIKYTLQKSLKVKLEIFNLLSQKIETILNKQMPAGSNEIEFTAKSLPSGVYLYRIEAGKYREVKKMVL